MKDTDTINLVCDVVVDLLVQQRKSSVPKKNCKIYLERDGKKMKKKHNIFLCYLFQSENF